jgi:hypothetical protein
MKCSIKSFFCFLFIAVIASYFLFENTKDNIFHTPLSVHSTPWAAVGGCGSSAGGASGDALVKWIGNGVLGALIDCEILVSQGVLAKNSRTDGEKVVPADYNGQLRLQTTTALLNLYYHPPKIVDIKLCMPFLYKEGTNVKDGSTIKTAPFGDLSLDINRKWGTTGSIFTALTLVFPTGYSSIMSTGAEALSSDNELGGGLFSSSLRGSYTLDYDWGIINLGGSYSAGLFAIRTTEYGYFFSINPAHPTKTTEYLTSEKKDFQYARAGLGALNDAGTFSPDYLGIFSDIGIKTEGFTHGFSINYSYPLAQGSSEIRDVNVTDSVNFTTKESVQSYLNTNAAPGTKNFAMTRLEDGSWRYLTKTPARTRTLPALTLQYSVEKNDAVFPILLGGVAKMEYEKKLVFSGFSVALGFKFPVY